MSDASFEWQPIATAPLDRTLLVIVDDPDNDYYPDIARWDAGRWLKHITVNGTRLYLGVTPTHWADCPPAPSHQ